MNLSKKLIIPRKILMQSLASTPASTKRNEKYRINHSKMTKQIQQKMSKNIKKTRLCRKIQHGVSSWFHRWDLISKRASASDPFLSVLCFLLLCLKKGLGFLQSGKWNAREGETRLGLLNKKSCWVFGPMMMMGQK